MERESLQEGQYLELPFLREKELQALQDQVADDLPFSSEALWLAV